MTAPPRRRFLFGTVLLVGSVLVALVAGELLLRALDYRFALHPESVQFGWPDPIELQKRYVVDRELLWVPRDYRARVDSLAAAGVDIVLAGDSCTEFGRYDRQLAKRIGETRSSREAGAAGSGRATVAQLGAGGWSSYQGLRQLERDLVALSPAVVTFYFGWNDHWSSFGIEDKEIGRFHRYRDPESGWRRLRLVQLADALAYKRVERATEGERPPRVSPEDFRSNLVSMIQVCRDHDIIPVLVTAPTSLGRAHHPRHLQGRWIDDHRRAVPLHRRYAEIVREVAAGEGVLLIDLAAHFDALPPEELAETYFMADGIHLKWPGNARIGDLMYEALEENGLLSPRH